MLHVATLLEDAKELLEFCLRQETGEEAVVLWFVQSQPATRLLTDIQEGGVVEPFLAGNTDELCDDR